MGPSLATWRKSASARIRIWRDPLVGRCERESVPLRVTASIIVDNYPATPFREASGDLEQTGCDLGFVLWYHYEESPFWQVVS